jgi:hypothetical protein
MNMSESPAKDQLLLTGEVARWLDITPNGVRALVKNGQLTPDEKTPTGFCLFRVRTIEKLVEAREQKRIHGLQGPGGRLPRKPSERRFNKD